ncbi:phosphoribosylformylglycinamidine synthase [Breznakiella homolactica]|uniref:Phosphoribosylformylglycinamidine synthase n=1 Tax=Breznakiella homolactica TaxID=2798577 RepID=A0A7T7XPY0_9SPIR|nr:phosphoribosylformylglycinamidine synthase [Breznakiella homolactica]QQO10335.1 phosphoribosylformylglycinamidine synthase [Breznakiella homolactica]
MPDVISNGIQRVFVEKKPGFDTEARHLQSELTGFLGTQYPELIALEEFRLLHRYDVAHLDEVQFKQSVELVFSEPQCDRVFYSDSFPVQKGSYVFAVEYLPGQYDQRADSAEQCIELTVGVKPLVRTARIFMLRGKGGTLSDAALGAIKNYLINPVDSREASLEMPETLDEIVSDIPDVPVLAGFTAADDRALGDIARDYGLAMSGEDLRFCREYFFGQNRDPSLAELRVLDTYWSDHCRHTTFTTSLETIDIEEGPLAEAIGGSLDLYRAARNEVYGNAAQERPVTLMDLATLGTKVLKKRGLLPDLDESKEINACSVKVQARFEDGSSEPWLLLFKNETHNHPTEIEPFGGAATCLGGAIRDPLSGRAYVHQCMRVTGGGDPRQALSETLPGKLPQLKIAREAAAGYASYGNQIGIATGQVAEVYHPGFTAKRMELGAVVGAVPEQYVRREDPKPGDLVLLIGGKTGRDGIGGATGSSKVHTGESVESAGAEVQKGNPVEERKLQRLFRDCGFTRLIKRCNDFGAGGVSVAVGELAPGLDISLDAVPKKYQGLDGTELAISESQERMAVVVAADDAETVIRYAADENLQAVVIAEVTAGDESENARLRMFWRGRTIVDLFRKFLDSNGAPRSAKAFVAAADNRPDSAAAGKQRHVFAGDIPEGEIIPAGLILDNLERELASLRSGSRRGLQERFDGSIGAGSVLFPWGGEFQGTPECGMAALLPALDKSCVTASIMTFGYDPDLAVISPYRQAKAAVRDALAKFTCLGGDPSSARLSLQEYFERAETPASWGKPLAALLGAFEAQIRLGIPAIGGKDSMSGSYKDPARDIDISVPPTLAAFAAGSAPAERICSGALSTTPGNLILLFYTPPLTDSRENPENLNEWDVFKANMQALGELQKGGFVSSCYPVGPGGVAVTLAVMAFGNMAGVEADSAAFSAAGSEYQGCVLAEINGEHCKKNNHEFDRILAESAAWIIAARTIPEPVFRIVADDGDVSTMKQDESPEQRVAEVPLQVLRRAYEYPLSGVYPQTAAGLTAADKPAAGGVLDLPVTKVPSKIYTGPVLLKGTAPLVILPVFPGTNCEWDMARAFGNAGGRTRQIIFRNRDRQDILESTRELAKAIRDGQILALSGGFSAGDEPDGSGKFMANAFRAELVAAAVTELLEKRDGLILGICNGFQALIKLGLVPYGTYRPADSTMPTLTFNSIGRHVSRMVRTKVMSTASPWLAGEAAGDIHVIPVSHGEGRVAVDDGYARALFAQGQVPFCYADGSGLPTMAEPDNPNGSAYAIEGLMSPDGRILGKMGHSERCGKYVHRNIPGNKRQNIFDSGIGYFK